MRPKGFSRQREPRVFLNPAQDFPKSKIVIKVKKSVKFNLKLLLGEPKKGILRVK